MMARSMGYPTRHSAAELKAFLDKNLAGYRKEPNQFRGQLESYRPSRVSLQRGRCYMMVLRLVQSAQLAKVAEGGLNFIYEPTDGGMKISGGPGVHGPGGLGSGGCPQAPSTYDFWLEPTSAAPVRAGRWEKAATPWSCGPNRSPRRNCRR
jgi:hypothetical protein